jgi:hypothetical protein
VREKKACATLGHYETARQAARVHDQFLLARDGIKATVSFLRYDNK